MAVKISADEAAGLIQDGDVVVFAADGLVSFPNEIVDAAERRFLREGHPAGITSLRAAGMGNFIDTGEHGDAHPFDFVLSQRMSEALPDGGGRRSAGLYVSSGSSDAALSGSWERHAGSAVENRLGDIYGSPFRWR